MREEITSKCSKCGGTIVSQQDDPDVICLSCGKITYTVASKDRYYKLRQKVIYKTEAHKHNIFFNVFPETKLRFHTRDGIWIKETPSQTIITIGYVTDKSWKARWHTATVTSIEITPDTFELPQDLRFWQLVAVSFKQDTGLKLWGVQRVLRENLNEKS